MKRSASPPVVPSRALRSATRWAELWIAVPSVIAQRTSRMLAAGANPSPSDRAEMQLMVNEKTQAFYESFVAMAARQQRAQVEWWLAALRAWWTPWTGASARAHGSASQRALQRRLARDWHAIFDQGLAPIHRTATANARRLRRGR